MAAERWYPSVTPLNNGEMLITEGGPNMPEVRKTDGSLRALNSASLNLPLYPWMDVAPDGRAFYSGPDQTMRSLNPAGGGSWQSFGQRDSINRGYGSRALYDVGKILVAGGGSSSKDARVIDVNGATPQVSATAPMAFGRRQHNLTVLADGTVLATGGNSSGASLVDLNNGVYAAELWNPATGTWTTLAAEQATRQYHSTALLLPDGRVLSSGGGICGTCDQVGYLAKNAQVFTPPYLFKKDGSGTLAPRPTIAGAPGGVGYGAGFQIDTPDAAAIRKVALVRLGAVTHSVNMEQRYVPLTFSAGAGGLTATAPANANLAPPGVYMLFVVDANGVPSVAKMVSVGAGSPPPPDTSPPTAPTGLTVNAAGPSRVDLNWSASTDDVGVTGYRVERCQGQGCTNFAQVAAPSGTSYSDAGLSASTTYRYRVRAVDAATNLSGYSSVAEATTDAAPPAPSGLVGAWAFGEGSGTTTADASGNGNVGTITGASWSTQGRFGNALSFNGTNSVVRVAGSASLNLTSGMTLSAWIRPTASQSGWRTIVQRQTDAYFLNASNNAPMRPSGGGTFGGNVAYVSGPTANPLNTWTYVALTYDGGAMRLYVNGSQVATGAATGAIQTTSDPLWIGGNTPYGEYFQGLIDEVRVYNRALTGADIQADMNASIVPTAPDTTPPSTPTGLNAAAAGAGQINLNWTASTDNVGVGGYRVERCAGANCTNFAQVATPGGTAFNDAGLAPSTVYRYRIRAADLAGNLSPYSTIATATTAAAPDTTPPSAPTAPNATAVSTSRIDLTWAASTDNVGVTGYRVERCQGVSCTNFAQVGTPTTTDFSSTGLAASTAYRFRVRAVDAAGNLGPYSSIATATTQAAPDTTSPTAPTGLSATVVSPTQVNLGWTASTDDVGVTGYRVERCQGAGCTNFAEIGSTATTAFNSTGLAASTAYRFRVRAVDAAGNLSAYSSIATATTPAVPDTSPPNAPAGLTATAVGSSQVNLGWSASTDDVGVTGYRVERCQGPGCTDFAQVGTPTGTSFSDTGLSASTTYRYRVRAVDAAANLSAYSNIAEATTGPSPPTPTGLVGAWAFGEGAGTTTLDASGHGNAGTVTGAVWTTQGRQGNALSFDGVNSVVRVAESASLDLTSAMTLSAWIRPTAQQSGWRTILQRQVDAYFLNASNSDGPLRPSGGGTFGANPPQYLSGPTASPVNAWTHVALTYDGAALRLFINGGQVASRATSGTIETNNNPLWIGGNSPYGEYFNGLIDEVRVYNRALTQADIQTDMNSPIDWSGLPTLLF